MKLSKLVENGKLCIRVISLKYDVDRRDKIQKMLSSFNLKFEFIDAVDGRSMNAWDFFKLSCTSKKRVLSPAELGCSLSHQKTYNEFLNSDYDYLMVLEDDVLISNFSFFDLDFNENLNDFLLILGGQDGLRRPKLLSSVRLKRMGVYNQSFYWRLFQRTCCYIVSRDRASEIVNLWDNGAFLADDWYHIVNKTRIKGILYFPMFTHPVDLTSSKIEEERLLIGQNK